MADPGGINLQQLVAELSASLWDKATNQERRFPDQRVPIIHEEPFPVVPEADRATANYTPAYINNTHVIETKCHGNNILAMRIALISLHCLSYIL